MFTKSLALEWARYNINVNAIGPGFVPTRLTEQVAYSKERSEKVMRGIPMRRFGEPRDMALAAVYLASDASNFVTGQCIYVDGGFAIA